MFAYLINLGFSEKQIVDYVRSTDYSLDQLYRLCLKTTMACHVDERQRTVGRTGIAW